MKKILITSLIGALSLAFLSNCRRFKTFEEKVEWVTNKLSSKLDLDDTQNKTLNKIKLEILAKKSDLHPKDETMMKEVISEIKGNTFDKEKINSLFEKQHSKHVEMRTFFVEKMAEFHAILRQDQRVKLGELMEKFSEKHRKRWRH